ncbi:CRISPR-associated protein Csx14 [Methanospirillum stamsii]|uniref:CRISPR-associated protein Csx14 n=1 Tax=Methanospirillum stamsii TaxID=1277351 RepID=A0A2V2N2R2_9EURY|nr:CRISPR-associated protein Csx14 [Methanospirillum stamsii]PWR70457.1 CRISPR-associated protein Csx14 [Methanospirillum stamsii]
MKTAVIAPIGMSPPVITEFIDGIGEPVSDLVLIATSHPQVLAGVNLVKAGLTRKYQWLRIHVEILPFEDIATSNENFSFMKKAVRIFKEEREKFHCDTIYLNVAGGRKNMCITLALVGQLMGADGVFHLVSHNVEWINERLEMFRAKIGRFGDVSSPEEANSLYEEDVLNYDSLLFPDRKSYEIIRIPTLPYPTDYLGYLVAGMSDRGAGLTGEDKELLEKNGMIDRAGSVCDLTPHGEAFLEVIFNR